MRINITTKYIEFPLSEKLTKRSQLIGALTHPIMGFLAGTFLAPILTLILESASIVSSKNAADVMRFAMPVCWALGIFLLIKYRNKRFEDLKKEYRKMLASGQYSR